MIGIRSSVAKHMITNKHKISLDTAASTSKLSTSFKTKNFGSNERKLTIMKNTFAFVLQFIIRVLDCTAKLLSIIIIIVHNVKFSYARTKYESIITGVFNEYCKTMLLEHLRVVLLLQLSFVPSIQ